MPLPLPTFTSGAILTAVQLNQMVTAVNTLNGVIRAPNIGFQQIAYGGDGAGFWLIRHQTANRYLHVYYTFDGSGGDDLWVDINGSNIHANASPALGQTKLVLDLNSLGLTVDAFYQVKVSWEVGAATGASVQLVLASDRSGTY